MSRLTTLMCLVLLATNVIAQPGLHHASVFGSTGDDFVEELLPLDDGGFVVAGWTDSPGFPITPASSPFAGDIDGAIVRVSPAGQVVWSVLLGGTGKDRAYGLALVEDGSGDIVVGGHGEADFPTTPGALATGIGGGFVTQLDGDDGSVVWATQLPGGRIRQLRRDNDGSLLVAGAASVVFPATVGAFDETFNGGVNDAFAARISGDGTQLIWGTFLGGGGDHHSFEDSEVVEGALDAVIADGGEFVLTGATDSDDFPVTAGAPQSTYADGGGDGFVTRLSQDGSALVYSTYLGGSGNDHMWRIVRDRDDSVIVGGDSRSPDYPVTAGAYDTTFNDGPPAISPGDAVLTRLSPDGSTIVWSTYIGGNNNEHVHGLAIDQDGTIIGCCSAESFNLPVTAGAFDQDANGGEDAYLFRISADGSHLLYGSYYGGLKRTTSHALQFDPDGLLLFAGPSQASDLPTTADAADPTPNGQFDMFWGRFDLSPCAGDVTVFGPGCDSAAGFPQVLDGMGCPTPGGTLWVSLRYLAPQPTTMYLFFGLGLDSIPIKPGCHLSIGPLSPALIILPLPTSEVSGSALLLSTPIPPGTPAATFGIQALLADPSAPSGVSGTPALIIDIGP